MNEYRLQAGLKRTVVDGFAFALGITPEGIEAPHQGYTVEYHLAESEEDEQDAYAFQVVVSHERLRECFDELVKLLRPDAVYGVIEIGSRDAYRAMDLFRGREAFALADFLDRWSYFEPFLLEDGTIGAGLYSEDPFVEIFLDAWKGLTVHVPVMMREQVEARLDALGLREVPETWSHSMLEQPERFGVRPVLALDDDYAPDVDELLLELREAWELELETDTTANVDDGGRVLGRTLWHALVIISSNVNPDEGAYASIWATATSMDDLEHLVERALMDYPQYTLEEYYWKDRVAYDDRPEELNDLPPRVDRDTIHLMTFEPWNDDSTAPSSPTPRDEPLGDDSA